MRLEEYQFQKFSDQIVSESSESIKVKPVVFLYFQLLLPTATPFEVSTSQLAVINEVGMLNAVGLRTIHSGFFTILANKAAPVDEAVLTGFIPNAHFQVALAPIFVIFTLLESWQPPQLITEELTVFVATEVLFKLLAPLVDVHIQLPFQYALVLIYGLLPLLRPVLFVPAVVILGALILTIVQVLIIERFLTVWQSLVVWQSLAALQFLTAEQFLAT